MHSVPHSRPLASPAGLALAAKRVTHQQLADQMGCSRRSISAYLDGTRTPPAGLRPALVALVGSEHAERVIAAIPSPDPERLAA